MSPAAEMMLVVVPMTMSNPLMVSGLPALPMPAIRPSLMPISALKIPSTGSRTTTLLITTSRQLSRGAVLDAPMLSRAVLATPALISSP
jgi:hypothetical protein